MRYQLKLLNPLIQPFYFIHFIDLSLKLHKQMLEVRFTNTFSILLVLNISSIGDVNYEALMQNGNINFNIKFTHPTKREL